MSDFTSGLRPHSDADGKRILQRERDGSTIDVQELTKHLFGTAYLERQKRVLSIIEKEKIFSKTNQANLSRPDRYKLGLARGKRMRQLMDINNWNEDDLLMAEYLVDDIQPYHLHMSLFAAAMREQCSEEQWKYWMPKIAAWEIIGAYAQTELGHGSNVRGIELTATWDHQTKEFILHSATLTASKWWNGTLGRTATHAVVVAQLIIPSQSSSQPARCGPRPFIVQVRDMKTHQPPKSIVVGDIGPKYGYAPMDNAYMLFNRHRIPHSALLCRYASLDPETGVYSKPKNPSSVYGQLTRGRAIIVMNSRLVLARAVTIAVRYLSIRRQFRNQDSSEDSGPETPVLDYTSVQIRILPLLATTFALHYTGKAIWELYERTRSAHTLDSDNAELAELHSTSAGLKSLATELSANGIEICRRAMGGHGFGGGTGLVQINADWLSKPTVEGDNWMITQQVARYLLKIAGKVQSAGSSPSQSKTEARLREYMRNRNTHSRTEVFANDAAIVRAFHQRVSFLAWEAYDARIVRKQSWNDLLIDFHKLSRAYSQALLVSNFYAALQNLNIGPATKDILFDLFRLFSFYTIDVEAREFQRSKAVSSEELDQLGSKLIDLMKHVRPHAVPLVDSFALPDYLLNSALGRFDGEVYEDLFHRAHRLNPLNRLTFNPDYKSNEIVMGSGDNNEILAKL